MSALLGLVLNERIYGKFTEKKNQNHKMWFLSFHEKRLCPGQSL